MNHANCTRLGVALACTLLLNVAAADDDMTDLRKQTADNARAANIERAKARHEDAMKACAPLQGNAADVCEERAAADLEKAKADATTDGDDAMARADANEQQREAEYEVALERCDDLDGDAEDACEAEAKLRYAQ